MNWIKNSQRKRKSRGQTLLEIVVTMGLGLVIISGIAIVTVNGLKNSQLAKDQAIATKLAQDGLEKVRSIRSLNCQVLYGTQHYVWDNESPPTTESIFGNAIFTIVSPANPPQFIINSVTPPPVLPGPRPTCLSQAGSDLDQVTFPNFTRRIELVNDSVNVNVLRVTAIVTWSDYSGDHVSKIATTLSNNR